MDGRYEVFATHGKGVFSTVLRARDRKAQTMTGVTGEVAIKMIRANDTMYTAGQVGWDVPGCAQVTCLDPSGQVQHTCVCSNRAIHTAEQVVWQSTAAMALHALCTTGCNWIVGPPGQHLALLLPDLLVLEATLLSFMCTPSLWSQMDKRVAHPSLILKLVAHKCPVCCLQTEKRILRKLADADQLGRRHCIKLQRSFEYRGHLCLVFDAMVSPCRDSCLEFD